jgi:hypothetical protein
VYTYAAYGGLLHSELSFPELPDAAESVASHAWHLRLGSGPAPALDAALLGERMAGAESYTLWRIASGFRLEYSHAGVFDVHLAHGDVTWYPRGDGNAELARAIVIGPIAALLLESMGDLCLHGSAVLAPAGAIAFVGPKHHGKSTLALALTGAGCRLMSDDLVAITQARPPLVRPAVPTVRLWSDAAGQLRPRELCDTQIEGVKHTLGRFHDGRVASSAAPLAAIHVLVPAPASQKHASRTRLGGAEAVIALAQQKKLADSLIGYGDAASRLPLAAAVAAATPVYELHVPRDFSLLPGVVEQIMNWYGGSSSSNAADEPVSLVEQK